MNAYRNRSKIVSPSYFTIETSNGYNVDETPESESWLPKLVVEYLNKAMDLSFGDETSFKEDFSYIDSITEDNEIKYYSIRLGSFTEWKGKFTLEQEFDTMKEAYTDLLQFSLGEKIDFIYRPYILIEVEPED